MDLATKIDIARLSHEAKAQFTLLSPHAPNLHTKAALCLAHGSGSDRPIPLSINKAIKAKRLGIFIAQLVRTLWGDVGNIMRLKRLPFSVYLYPALTPYLCLFLTCPI